VSELIDQSRPVREGEELDREALDAYLRPLLPEASGPLEIEQFPGGHSNLTYLLRFGDDEYILRRPPFGSRVKSAHDMGREARILGKLGPAYGKAPSPLVHCTANGGPLGVEFYVMERLRGLILRKQFPPGLEPTEELTSGMCEALVSTLAELHAIDYRDIGLGDLGHPEGYVQRQVEGWSKRYEAARTDDIPAVERIAAWLVEHVPISPAPSLIHNDFKFDNLVLDPEDPTRVVGILDWEMATVGDPLMDLGTALGYWVEAGDPPGTHMMRFGPTHLPGMWSRRQVAERYRDLTGRSVEQVLFYYVFGLFKSIGVVQQIYYRFHKGLTKDPRFGQFIHAVRILSEQAELALEHGHI
jgi:aminoglycoside phosphotransferase (APT) family kinase protein